MKLALFGGSFNPIHIAHLIIAERVVDALQVDRLLFMPCSIPALKSGEQMAEVAHRLNMVRRAIAGNPRFRVSELELRRGGKSYTVETLRVLKKKYRLEREDLFLVIGGDNLADFVQWRDPEEISRLCRVAVADRPESDYTGRIPPYLTDVVRIDTPLMAVSSTDIRKRLREGRSIRYLVPSTVERYIRLQQLYLG
ncbi:MAG TPA: nicotinate (nicotinamide) nucleotide adenylyltransferase [bacterium]|nr:nicotinate (nicotinamide) nucleotide adenylyltransferase [bacterium]HQI48647.1 nicotinate (nicotinamide) nucleotide adenylyltransferase [bacterium]HQJ66105.1 nicotinate (nicotinamide) nucleotide adenylyltransferase [bacterium]